MVKYQLAFLVSSVSVMIVHAYHEFYVNYIRMIVIWNIKSVVGIDSHAWWSYSFLTTDQ